MGKKRQLETNHNIKSTPVEVIMDNLESHPLCLHGPTLLFSGTKGRYFSCSSCRNKKDCTVHITEEDWANEHVKKRNQKYLQLIPTVDKVASWENFKNVSYLSYYYLLQWLTEFLLLFTQKYMKLKRLYV